MYLVYENKIHSFIQLSVKSSLNNVKINYQRRKKNSMRDEIIMLKLITKD
jgi:hypothetical protein